MDNEEPDFMLPDTLTTNALGILPLTTDANIFTMNNASGAALNDPAQFPYHFAFANSKSQDVAAMTAGTKKLRSEEHTSELQSLMRTSYAAFCLKKKNTKTQYNTTALHSLIRISHHIICITQN